MNRNLVMFGVASLFSANVAAAQPHPLESGEAKLLNAVLTSPKNELAIAMDAMLTDDFVYQHGSGQNFSKRQYAEYLSNGEITVESLGNLNIDVRDYGDVAVTYGGSNMTGFIFGSPYDGYLRFVNVWVRDGGAWRLQHRNSELLPRRD